MWGLRVAFCTLSALSSLSSAAESKARSCSEVRQAFTVKGFGLVDVPHQEISGRRERKKSRWHVSCRPCPSDPTTQHDLRDHRPRGTAGSGVTSTTCCWMSDVCGNYVAE
ncbi:unnamed protein product [Lampetra planeri]